MTAIWWYMCYNYIRRQDIMVLSPCCCCLPRSMFHPLHRRFFAVSLETGLIWGQKLFFTYLHRAWNTSLRPQLGLWPKQSRLTLPQSHPCLPSNSQLWPLFYMGIPQLPTGNAKEISKPFIDLLFCLYLGQKHTWDLLRYFAILLLDWNIWLISLTMYKAIP